MTRKERIHMQQRNTFLGNIGDFFVGIGMSIRYKGWWRTILWLVWLALIVVTFSAVFGSIAEYEPRAAAGYAIIALVILAVGIWAAVSGRSRAEAR